MKNVWKFLFICTVCIVANHAQAAWFNDDWTYRIQISSEDTLIGSGETDIPLMLDLDTMPDEFFSSIQTNGNDIVVTTSDEVTQIEHELVEVDTANKTGELHFKAPTLSASSATDFYIYFGNSNALDSSNANIWSDYRGVWHFNEDISISATGTTGAVSQAAMDGSDGSWAAFHGSNPISTLLRVVVDEDQISDTERAHTAEQVGYWIFDNGPTIDIVNSTGTVIGEAGVVSDVTTTSQTVTMQNTYTDPIVITTPRYVSGAPAVARLDSIGANSFDVLVQNPGGIDVPDSTFVYYVVLESGAHTLPGGVAVEADSVSVSGVNRSGDWSSGEMNQITPSNTYINPVVLGSVQTSNDSGWQVFWSSDGNDRENPPTASDIYVGRHVGADSDRTRSAEDVGYIIIEQSTGSVGSVNWRAGLGADSVKGVDDAPPYTYPGFTSGGGGVVAGLFLDSTTNDFHADTRGAITSRQTGQVGFAVSGDGERGSYLPITGLNYTNQNDLDEITTSFWLNTTDTARSGIFDFDRSEHWQVGLNFHNANGQGGRISFDTAASTGGIRDLNSNSTVNDGAWHYITTVFDANDAQDKKIYIDGVLDIATDQHSTGLGRGTTRFGIFADGSEAGSEAGNVNNLPYEGLIDEARILHTAVDADWIATTYENLANNATFWNVSSIENQNEAPEAPTSLYFNYDDASAGLSNPTDVSVYGSATRTPVFSALFNDPDSGDTASRVYIQVSTDSTFTTTDHWDSDWFTLSTSTVAGGRIDDIEYDSGGTAAADTLAMNDGAITYYWRIAFEDAAGLQGDFSSPGMFTLLDIPNTPSGVSVIKNNGSSSPDFFDITWLDTSTSEESFEIEFREDTGSGFGSWTAVTSPTSSPSSANVTSWTYDGTVDNAAYNFRVRACNYSGCSAWDTDPLTHFTDPEAPVDVCAAHVSDTEFTIDWTNRAIFDESTVEQCDGSADCALANFSTLATGVTEPPPSVSSSPTVTNEIYRWSVFADNGVATSSPTYSPFEYTSPAAPTGVTAARISDTLIDISWTDASDFEDGFQVYVSEDGGSYTEVTPGVNTVGANATSTIYTNAQAGHSYQFQVYAHIGATAMCGDTTNSELVSSAGTSDTLFTTPSAPTNTTGNYIDDDEIDVIWSDTSDFEDGFVVHVRENGGAWNAVATTSADTTSYTYTAGNTNSTYEFFVDAFINADAPENPELLRNPSAPANISGSIYTTPDAPTLSTSNISSVSVDWSVADAADYERGFNVYDEDENLTRSVPASDITGFTESGLTPNTSYTRTVRAYVENNGGALFESSDSNSITLVTRANSPGNATTTESNGLIKVTWDANSNPTGTEYFITNNTTGESSGWVTDLFSWNESNFDCEATYEYSVKARNDAVPSVETGEELLEITTGLCPGSEGSDSESDERRRWSFSNIFNLGRDDESSRTGSVVVDEVSTDGVSENTSFGQGESLTCDPYIESYIRYGSDNNSEDVRKLEEFLNEKQGENLIVDGLYGLEDVEAVKRFQEKYKSAVLDVWGVENPTGYVYKTTLLKINSFYCNHNLKCPVFSEYNGYIENKNIYSNEVRRTKELLTSLGFFVGEVDSQFGTNLHQSLISFQEEFSDTMLKPWGLSQGTGYKYKTTNKFLNYLVGCDTGAIELDGQGVLSY